MALLITPVTLVLTFLAILQAGIGVAIIWKKEEVSATRFISALLLFLNALAAGGIAIQALPSQPSWTHPFVNAFDGPTGALLILLAYALWRESEPDCSWHKGTKAGLIIVALAYIPVMLWTLFAFESGRNVRALVAASIPVTVGFAVLLLVLARRLAEATKRFDSRYAALLLAAYGSRAVEFAWVYGVPATDVNHWARGLLGSLNEAFQLALLFVALFATVSIAKLALRGPRDTQRHSRAVLWVFMGATALGIVELAGLTAIPWPGSYFLTLLTLFIVRPVVVGLAFESPRTVTVAGGFSLAFGVLVGAKASLSGVLGTPFLQVSMVDLVAVGLLAFLAPALIHASRLAGGASGIVRASTDVPGATRPGTSQLHRLEKSHLLAAYLLEYSDSGQHELGATTAEIEEATSISRNYVGQVVKLCRELLARHLDGEENGDELVVETKDRFNYNRCHYRLTEVGQRAAQRLVKVHPELRSSGGDSGVSGT